MKSTLFFALCLLFCSAASKADTIEQRQQKWQERKQQERDAQRIRTLQNAKLKSVRQVSAFVAAHGGAASEPTCIVQMVGTEVGRDTRVALNSVMSPSFLWVQVCTVYLRNGWDCNVVPGDSHASAGCYDRNSNYHELN